MMCIDYRILLVVYVSSKSSKSLWTADKKIDLFAYVKTLQTVSQARDLLHPTLSIPFILLLLPLQFSTTVRPVCESKCDFH